MMEIMSVAQLTTRRLACRPRPEFCGIVVLKPRGLFFMPSSIYLTKRARMAYSTRIIQQHASSV
jgi:hypothetical protein